MDELARCQKEFIERLLKEQGINGNELAERLGVSYVTVSRWRTGAVSISDENIRKIQAEFPEYGYGEITGLSAAFSSYNDMVAKSYKDRNALWYLAIKESFFGEIKSPAIDLGFDPWSREVINSVFVFTKNGKSVTLTYSQMKSFEKEISSYIEMRLDAMLERGAW